MSSIDEQIASKMASKDTHKSKKSKKKKHHAYNDDASEASSKHSASYEDVVAERKRERRMHNLASSGLPKAPPELEYNLNPAAVPDADDQKGRRRKKKNYGDLKSPLEEMATISETTIPGAVAAFDSDVSPAERMKFGHSSGSNVGAASMPGAKHERVSDMSDAERLKHGYRHNQISSRPNGAGASMPGAKHERVSDMSEAERLKHDYYRQKMSSGPNVAAAASMPGAKQEHVDDMSEAERLKHGYRQKMSSGPNVAAAASMSGAKQEHVDDTSEAERLKHGYRHNQMSSGSNVASVGSGSTPGAKHEYPSELSQAEWTKHSHNNRHNESNYAEMPGVKQERSSDMSQAERLKHGHNRGAGDSQSNYASMPGAVAATDHDVDAATRLKFREATGSNTNQLSPGVVESSNINTTEAERVKFGLVQNFAGGSDYESDSYAEDETSQEMNKYKSDDGDSQDSGNLGHYSYHDRRTREVEKSSKSLMSDMDPEHGISFRRDSYMEPSEINPDPPDEKREVDGWRTCCMICSCISFIIIIALAASLGAAKKRAAPAPTAVSPSTPADVAAKAVAPSKSPSLAPTTAPEDYSFCYESNEMTVLNDNRYSSIRTELVASGVSTSNEFSNNASYQRKSLCWLAFGDRLGINASDPFLEQRYVLATIYFGLNESQTLLDSGWLSGKTECQWENMVECDERTDSTVTRLNLNGNFLIGELPKEMNYLKDMTYLDVSANQLQGDFLAAIGNWTYLSTLMMGLNEFTAIPSDLSVFPSLKKFDIHGNRIGGSIPETLTSATNLAFLDISTNSFNDTIPTVLGELKFLETLYMHMNDLEGSVPEEICALRSNGALDHLTVDCEPLQREVECDCCTWCGNYDTDKLYFGDGGG